MTICSIALALALSAPPPETPAPESPFFELTLEPGAPQPMLTIAGDGAWVAGPTLGQLTQDEIARLDEAMAKTKFVATLGPPCPGIPGFMRLRTTRGEVRWSLGCGYVADPSVRALVELAERMTTRRPDPVVVKLERWRAGEPDMVEAVSLMRTGAWTTHRGRGTLDAVRLAAVIAAFDAALIEAPSVQRADVCRGDFPHHIELPGRGEVRYIWPCQKPSPSLQAALDLLFMAVGLSGP